MNDMYWIEYPANTQFNNEMIDDKMDKRSHPYIHELKDNTMKPIRFFLPLFLIHCLTLPLIASEEQDVFFVENVFPLLQTHCLECHGKDVQHGELRLDAKEIAFKGGKNGPAIVAGDTDNSLLLQRLLTDKKQMRMPLGKDPLKSEEINIIKKWIEQGAVWKEGVGETISEIKKHWAFKPPHKAEPPQTNKDIWGKNEIDAFVFKKLVENQLSPSKQEERKKLIRRMYLDTIGLPPNIEELNHYAADDRSDWDQHLIDDLLASPHYGEKWGRHWLDAVRYADTNGYEKDRHRDIWAYRNYVINSYNADKPFDQFTIEQIAGDLLPNAELEQLIATGYHRNTMHNEEGGVEVEEFRFESIVDRVNTTANVFLGLTVACAQCHTHKYDPVTHHEYYQFFAYFNNCDEVSVKIPNKEIDQKRKRIKTEIQDYLSNLSSHYPATDLHTDWKTTASLNYATIEGVLLHEEEGMLHTFNNNKDNLTYILTITQELETFDRIRIHFNEDVYSDDFLVTYSVFDSSTNSSQTLKAKSVAAYESERQNHLFVMTKPIKVKKNDYIAVKIESKRSLPPFRIDVGLESRLPVPANTDISAAKNERLNLHFQSWLIEKREQASEWQPLIPQKMESQNHTLFKTLPDHSILAYGDMPNNDVYTVVYTSPQTEIRALQLTALKHPSLPGEGPGRGTVLQDGNFMLSELIAEIVSNNQVIRRIEFDSAFAASHAKNATAGYAIDGDRNTGWSIQKNPLQIDQAVFRLKEPVRLKNDEQLRITLDQNYIHTYTLGRFKICATNNAATAPTGLPEYLENVLQSDEELPASAFRLLRHYFLLETPELAGQQMKLASLINSIPPQSTSLIVRERDVSRTTNVYHRGEYLHPIDEVEPGVLSVLHPIASNQEPIPPRLQMAKWLVNRNNPLTARVTVNRIWMRYFGRGIVETVDDFGTRGSLPSHPELLDWLAVKFMENDWSVKHIHRLILSSATYQQSANVSEHLIETDPNNEWYSRGPRFRLDAELIRDTALSISGLLTNQIGGKSVFPPLPDGLGSLSYGGLKWQADTDENRYRRGLYTYWKRTNPYPMLTTFDAPTADTSCVQRDRSNTPLQALTLLNDTTFFEASQALAYRILTEKDGSLSDKLCYGFELCTARKPNQKEIGSLIRYYGKQYLRIINHEIIPVSNPIQVIDIGKVDQNQWQAWTMVSRVLLNLDETVTK